MPSEVGAFRLGSQLNHHELLALADEPDALSNHQTLGRDLEGEKTAIRNNGCFAKFQAHDIPFEGVASPGAKRRSRVRSDLGRATCSTSRTKFNLVDK